MSNMLMIHHAATRSREREAREMNDRPGMEGGAYDRRTNYGRPGMTYNNDGAGMRQANQYTPRSDYDGGAESRYRGRNGRWKAGTRRSEYEPGMTGDDPMENRFEGRERRMGDDEEGEEGRKYKIEVLPSNVVEWPHADPERNAYRTSRQIGFGAMTMHGDHEQKEHHMERGMASMEPMEFDRETAEHWVRSMRNEDKAHPVGGKWNPDMLRPLAQKYGIPTEGKKFWEFYAMTNAMYSDYGEVARKFGITSPEFYVCMAKAWMEDKDAEPDKTALYYEYIVKKAA